MLKKFLLLLGLVCLLGCPLPTSSSTDQAATDDATTTDATTDDGTTDDGTTNDGTTTEQNNSYHPSWLNGYYGDGECGAEINDQGIYFYIEGEIHIICSKDDITIDVNTDTVFSWTFINEEYLYKLKFTATNDDDVINFEFTTFSKDENGNYEVEETGSNILTKSEIPEPPIEETSSFCHFIEADSYYEDINNEHHGVLFGESDFSVMLGGKIQNSLDMTLYEVVSSDNNRYVLRTITDTPDDLNYTTLEFVKTYDDTITFTQTYNLLGVSETINLKLSEEPDPYLCVIFEYDPEMQPEFVDFEFNDCFTEDDTVSCVIKDEAGLIVDGPEIYYGEDYIEIEFVNSGTYTIKVTGTLVGENFSETKKVIINLD